ncbi:uncharacterized protein Z519_12135 [Cladophialophora bantiana CBS 173.52]|uniref:Uncharacterized protein n=1 Tax=Cladophialophora bantiana (strain ATCC 10958 / CBS 173.52 / CDC B-1940 / NIH 8579) TaxID=1442370 RepID=A0A0D2FKL4_CLAB1|nr:uncharacterized protein Z519_12135 [Cladophialophora bantiana CBS 173.52]KIW87232.1 hypothetical protein Z519_12135 [Cladophialophora bantiana CBS 173.52]
MSAPIRSFEYLWAPGIREQSLAAIVGNEPSAAVDNTPVPLLPRGFFRVHNGEEPGVPKPPHAITVYSVLSPTNELITKGGRVLDYEWLERLTRQWRPNDHPLDDGSCYVPASEPRELGSPSTSLFQADQNPAPPLGEDQPTHHPDTAITTLSEPGQKLSWPPPTPGHTQDQSSPNETTNESINQQVTRIQDEDSSRVFPTPPTRANDWRSVCLV